MKRSAKILSGICALSCAAVLTGCADIGWSLFAGPDGMPEVGVYMNNSNYMGPPPPPAPMPPPPPPAGPGPAWSQGPWFFADPVQ